MADITLSVDLDASAVKSTSDSLQQDVKDIFDKASSAKDLSAPFKNLLATMDRLAQKSASIKQKLEDLEKTPNVATPEYAKLSAEYDKLIAKQDRLNDRMTKFKALGGNVSSKPYKSMQYDMSELSAQIAKVQAQKDKLETAGQAFTPVVDTTQYQNLLTQLNGVNNQLTLCRDKAQAFSEVKVDTGIFDRLKSAIGNVGTAIQSGLGNLKSYFSSLSGVVPPISMIGVAFTNVAMVATRAIGGIFGLLAKLPGGAVKAGSAILKIGSGAKQALTPVVKLYNNVLKLAGGGILNGLKKLGSAIASVGKHAGSSSSGFEKGFKSFIRYGLGVRSIFALINKLRRALISGFENLAQVHEPFNRSVSNIISSVNLLKNTVAGAFAPIIEAVEPALVRLINLFSEATVKVGQFIAAITGKEFVRANYVQKDYAASLDATKKKNQAAAKAAKAAAKAAKKQAKEEEELKKQLLGFDDVEILHEDKDNDTDTTTDPTAGLDDTLDALQDDFSFTESPIESAIEAFVERFKKAWLNADFYDIGRIVGEKLKKALDSIPWDYIKETAWRIAKSLATFLNGFIETPGLFASIGHTIAEALNTGLIFANTFLENFHFDSFAKAIGEGINTAVKDFDWNLLVTTIDNAINGALTFAYNLINSVDWTTMVSNVANSLNNAFTGIDWNLLASTLVDGINTVFDMWYTFVTTFDFSEFGIRIGTAISRVLQEVNWAEGGASLAGTINGIFHALNGFIMATDWRALGKAVIDAVAGFFIEFDASAAGEFLGNIPIVIFETLSGAIQAVDWAQLPTNIINFIKDFLSGFNWAEIANLAGELIGAAFKALVEVGGTLWQAIKDCFHAVMDGGFEGIVDALKNVGTWIYDHIFKPFIDGFKAAFGIHSPAETMKPLGDNIIQGLYTGITDIIKNVSTWVKTNIADKFINAVKSGFGLLGGAANRMFSIGKSAIEGFKSGASNVMTTAGTWIKNNIADPILSHFKGNFGISNNDSKTFSNYGSTVVGSLRSGISNSSSKPIEEISSMQSRMQNVITSTMSKWLDHGRDLISNLSDGIKRTTDESRRKVEDLLQRLQETVNSYRARFRQAGEELAENMADGFSRQSRYLQQVAREVAEDMYYSFTQADWYRIGESIVDGIYRGVTNNSGSLNILAHNTAIDMYNAACEALDIHSPSKKFGWIGEMSMKGLAGGVLDNKGTVISKITDITTAMEKEAEKASPSITISESIGDWIRDLDTVLSTFGNMVSAEFDRLVASMGTLSAYNVPAVAQGRIVPPSSFNRFNQSQDLINLQRTLDNLSSSIITYDDLQAIIVSAFQQYLNINFYLEDEQLARHANAGNLKLDRRYNIINKTR